MSKPAVIDYKYDDIKNAVVSGRIVDEGCADGALMVKLAKDFPDSDIIGVDLVGEFIARCKERQRAGEFGGTFVHFYQRNLLNPIFEDESVDTVICNSTTHEIWSYGDGQKSLADYLKNKYKQLTFGGRLIIRDVVGPENENDTVYLWANKSDGVNENIFAQFEHQDELRVHLNTLSTNARFERFAKDFLSDMRKQGRRGHDSVINYKEETVDGQEYFVLNAKDASEFLSKKDYTDNWQSELNEEFAFMGFSKWKEFVSSFDFSRPYTNPWIVKNAFGIGPIRSKAGVFNRLITEKSSGGAWISAFASTSISGSYIADGRRDFYVSYGKHSWDLAAPYFLCKEAGCISTNLEGTDWKPGDRGLVIANKYLHSDLLKIANEALEK